MLRLHLVVLLLFTLTLIHLQVTKAMPTTTPTGGQGEDKLMKRDILTEIPNESTTEMHTTNTPIMSSSPSTTRRQACFHEGKMYLPGQEISRGFDGQNCYGTYCESGQVVAWDDFNCEPSTTTPPPPTTIPNTTPPGCFHEGKWYLPGQEISRGVDGNNWCYGTICDKYGGVMYWDNFNCASTTATPPWTTIPNSPPNARQTNTTPPPRKGCFHEGKWYRPGQYISRGFDGNQWCYGKYCDQDGAVISWDNFKCGTSTYPPTTTPPLPPTTILERPGCYHDGKWFEPGQEMSRVIDGTGCHGTYCDDTGSIVAWDDWNCITTTTTTKTTTTPPLPTTIPYNTPTSRQGCFYEGKWYRPGQEISRGFDGKNYCYGTYCDESGYVASWDNWKCGTTTTTTTPPPSTAPLTRTDTTPSIPTDTTPSTPTDTTSTPTDTTSTPTYTTPLTTSPTSPPGCYYRGRLIAAASIILESSNGNGWCYGKRCTNDGQLLLWDDFTCQEPKASKGCDYGGHWYATGTELFRKNASGCYGGVCEGNGQIKAWTRLDCKSENLFHGGRLKPSWCKHRGVVYPRGSVFAVKSLFKRHGFGWCRGAKCVANGRIVAWGPKWAPGYC